MRGQGRTVCARPPTFSCPPSPRLPSVFLSTMADPRVLPEPSGSADHRPANRLSGKPPAASAIRAVCIRLAEMVADQRHLAPSRAQETGSAPSSPGVGKLWPVTGRRITSRARGLELRFTGTGRSSPRRRTSGSRPRSATGECGRGCSQAPDSYWADDVVAGSSPRCGHRQSGRLRATPGRYSSPMKRVAPEDG
jgi:hypothetical protein